MSDAQFTNINMYSLNQYRKAMKNHMSKNDIDYVYYWYRRCGVNPIVGFATFLKEGMPRDNYAFGYGIHVDKTGYYKPFDRQVRYSAHCFMRHFYDGAEKNNFQTFIYLTPKSGEVKLISNKATYALYKYTPLWKVKYTNDTHGNFVYVRTWYYLIQRIDKVLA
jgi:hypothetical protein